MSRRTIIALLAFPAFAFAQTVRVETTPASKTREVVEWVPVRKTVCAPGQPCREVVVLVERRVIVPVEVVPIKAPRTPFCDWLFGR
jgi:hypothetical protein